MPWVWPVIAIIAAVKVAQADAGTLHQRCCRMPREINDKRHSLPMNATFDLLSFGQKARSSIHIAGSHDRI
jgi:hypothetical protein